MESRATLSGSASRIATCAIDCAISRNSCERHAMCATPKKKMIGSSAAAPSPIMIAAGDWSGPSAALQIRQIGPRQREAADHPGAENDRRDHIGGAGRAALQRVQDLPDRLLVVVGTGKRAVRRSAAPVSSGRKHVGLGDARRASCQSSCAAARRRGPSDASGRSSVVPDFEASWIADSAASVGSTIFFGLLAMSVVASRFTPRLGRPERTRPRHERVIVQSPSGMHCPPPSRHYCR